MKHLTLTIYPIALILLISYLTPACQTTYDYKLTEQEQNIFLASCATAGPHMTPSLCGCIADYLEKHLPHRTIAAMVAPNFEGGYGKNSISDDEAVMDALKGAKNDCE